MNGSIGPADVRGATADTTNVVLNFEPYQSHIVVFKKNEIDDPIKVDPKREHGLVY